MSLLGLFHFPLCNLFFTSRPIFRVFFFVVVDFYSKKRVSFYFRCIVFNIRNCIIFFRTMLINIKRDIERILNN